MRFTVDPHEHLVRMPLPVPICAHLADPFLAALSGKQRTKAVSPETDSFMTDVDAARKQDVHHLHQADHLRAGLDLANRLRFVIPRS